MSHVAKIEMEIKDLGCLAKAAEHLGLVFMQDQKTYKWWGHSVGDYPLPQGFTENELGKCEHALRVRDNHQAYEVGVVLRRDGKQGYTLLWDFYGGGYGLQEKIGKDGSKLKQEYAVQVAMKHARQQGYTVSRQLKQDGSVVLKAVRA